MRWTVSTIRRRTAKRATLAFSLFRASETRRRTRARPRHGRQTVWFRHWCKLTHSRWRQQLPGIRTLPTCANALRALALDDETRGTRLTGPKEALEIRTGKALP